jgi:hypothetical protein
MKTLALILLGTFAASVCSAQVFEAYGTAAIVHIANTPNESALVPSYNNYTAAGFTLGGTVNFLPLKVLTVGVDFRDTLCSQNTWLAGIQIKAKPPALRFKPYFKLAVGRTNLNSSRTAFGLDSGDGFYLYNAALGLDYKWKRLIDLRLLEIGDGRTLGAGSANPTNILTINTGVVVHLP